MEVHKAKYFNETDPLLRVIWSQGWTEYWKDVVDWKITLINKNTKSVKTIDLHKYNSVVWELKYMTGSNLAGSVHTWIKEKDGSAELFRNLVKT
jgi:hypothetical protein